MSAAFTHPLARDAKVWPTAGIQGASQPILVIITTLELDKSSKEYKASKVERLSDAAREWLAANAAVASDFLVMSRPKAWHGDRG